MSTDFYLSIDVPVAAIVNPDVGYHYKGGSVDAFMKLAPSSDDHTLDPAVVRECVQTEPSAFMGGMRMKLMKYSFPFGPVLKLTDCGPSGVQFYHRHVCPGSTIQLYACFLDNQGRAVPAYEMDAKKEKYVVYGSTVLASNGMAAIESFRGIINSFGLSEWTFDSTAPFLPPNMVSTPWRFAKSSLQVPSPSPAPNTLYYQSEGAVRTMGMSMCVSEDGGDTFLGVTPQLVPSPSYEYYPMVFASLAEPECRLRRGPCELFLVHFQWPGSRCLPCVNPDIYVDNEGFRMALYQNSVDDIFTATTVNLKTGSVGGGRTVNPRMLIREQKMPGVACPKAAASCRVSIQCLNAALMDAPLVQRVLQLYVCMRSGVAASRLAEPDPSDSEALSVYLVEQWLQGKSIIPGHTCQRLSTSITRAIVEAFDSPRVFDRFIKEIARLYPDAIDRSGRFSQLVPLLKGLAATKGGVGAHLDLQMNFKADVDSRLDAAFSVPVLINFV
jgi:hypothetical protein